MAQKIQAIIGTVKDGTVIGAEDVSHASVQLRYILHRSIEAIL